MDEAQGEQDKETEGRGQEDERRQGRDGRGAVDGEHDGTRNAVFLAKA